MKTKSFFSLFSPVGKSNKQKISLFIFTFLMLVLAGVCLGFLSLYFSAGVYKLELFSFYMQNFKLVLLNVLPFVLLCLLGWFATNIPWVAFLISGVFCLAYSFSNYWKLVSRDDALYAEDLGLIGEALQMTESYAQVTWQMVLAVFLVIFGCLFLALFAKSKFRKTSARIILPLVLVLGSIPLYTGVYTKADLYNSFTVWEELNPWFDNSNYISRGGIYPFVYSIQSAIPKPPENYDAKESQKVINSYEENDIPKEKQVNLMFVMYEAFSDLSKYTDFITGADPYKDFHALQAESYSGELVTNIFAGGTIDTERCVLTGFSNLDTFRRKSWSYAQYFSDMGYTTEGSHAGYKSFYNRQNINRNLGIENYRFKDNYFYKIYDDIPMDDIFMPEITRMFIEQVKSGKKTFSYNVTYQNHGPYEGYYLPGNKEYVPLSGIEPYDHAVVNNYLKGVDETGKYMLETVNKLRDLDEPVVAVFFGDHKPWLGDYSCTYAALGIDILEENEASFYNHYNTEYLIWANDAAKEILGNDFVGEGPTISPCYLMNVLFEQCGWEGPAYLKLSNEVKEKMPVVTTNNHILENGELIPETDISSENKERLSTFRNVQYYLSRDYYK